VQRPKAGHTGEGNSWSSLPSVSPAPKCNESSLLKAGSLSNDPRAETLTTKPLTNGKSQPLDPQGRALALETDSSALLAVTDEDVGSAQKVTSQKRHARSLPGGNRFIRPQSRSLKKPGGYEMLYAVWTALLMNRSLALRLPIRTKSFYRRRGKPQKVICELSSSWSALSETGRCQLPVHHA
jgi:hypothetical protein